MARYSLRFKNSVAKDLRTIPKRDVQALLKRIQALADEPRPRGCEKLTSADVYRVRQGRYRILYEIRDDVLIVLVIRVAKRSDAYEGT